MKFLCSYDITTTLHRPYFFWYTQSYLFFPPVVYIQISHFHNEFVLFTPFSFLLYRFYYTYTLSFLSIHLISSEVLQDGEEVLLYNKKRTLNDW